MFWQWPKILKQSHGRKKTFCFYAYIAFTLAGELVYSIAAAAAAANSDDNDDDDDDSFAITASAGYRCTLKTSSSLGIVQTFSARLRLQRPPAS